MLFKSLAALALVAAAPSHAAIVNASVVYEQVASTLLELRAAGLVPQYIPEEALKLSSTLSVRYPDSGVEAELGSIVPRNATLGTPVYSLNSTETVQKMDPSEDTLYTVLFLDAGAPGVGFPAGQSATVRHMLGNNYTVTGTNGTLMNTSAPITSYNAPAPPAGSGLHRYFQLVVAQPRGWMAPPAFSQPMPLVTDFVLADYLKQADLSTIVAASYFQVQADSEEPLTVTVSSTASVPSASVAAAVSSVSASIISVYSRPTSVAGSMAKDAAVVPSSALSAIAAVAVAVIAGAALL